MRLLRLSWKLVWFLAFLGMLAFNVAAFTVAGVSAAVNGAMAAVGVTTVAARASARAATAVSTRAVARSAARRVSTRVARGAARSVGSVVAQSVPFVGAAAVVGVTAWEISDACAMLDDLHQLERALDALEPPMAPDGKGASLAGTPPGEAEREEVCGQQVPTVAEVRDAIAEAPGEAWAQAQRWLSEDAAPPPLGVPPAED
ncbi:hypothetical protein P2H44_15040 [Albimonas sp. CAU 1670]|uniref:hypothetical protein n=1 Tax=Albimonas sp. CAU 1670 TaxID=3032599 RepID=UPI0023DBF0DB|nr:hypothetical protein [Albimonas sp. CAU 1670]MDF2233874.1 hypothetical protein [Albimonas sp. CAU 1670]